MNTVHIKKGYQLRLIGAPAAEVEVLPRPARVAVVPERLRFVKPRLTVKVGDRVKVGSVLFEDKRHPGVFYRSPGAGTVSAVSLGPRRLVRHIVVDLDEQEAFEEFGPIDRGELERIDRLDLIDRLMAGGLWPLVRELPFRDAARREARPPALFVHLDNLDPFHPLPPVYLRGCEDLFEFGLRALERAADAPVNVSLAKENAAAINGLRSRITHLYTGNYPAHDPGVLLYRTKRSAAENHSWFISGQGVLLLGQFLQEGRLPTEQTLVIAGPGAQTPRHVRARIGAPIAALGAGEVPAAGIRCVAGGVFSGQPAPMDSFLNAGETSLVYLAEGAESPPAFRWMLPGREATSYSRTFLSSFTSPRDRSMSCNRHGGLRACIQCGFCARVCPVDILPQLTYKAALAEEVEESLSHGLLDCVECGLCAFVCPSKIDLLETLRRAREAYYDDIA
ncbi:MAG: 4Fe-4S dicluster domain-containing protein [Desulfobacterales bacterium]|jgi:Na+-transporting NADH:ubiquinone oxidoreductase subunit A|nr:4Fe-4S dicluster domain-containing protein [Desulfobacterales bacterium]